MLCKNCNKSRRISARCKAQMCLECCVKQENKCSYRNHDSKRSKFDIINVLLSYVKKLDKQNKTAVVHQNNIINLCDEMEVSDKRELIPNDERKLIFNKYINLEYNNEFNSKEKKVLEYKLISDLSLKVLYEPYLLECYHIFNKEDLEYLFNQFSKEDVKTSERKTYSKERKNQLVKHVLFKCPNCNPTINSFYNFVKLKNHIKNSITSNKIEIEFNCDNINIREIDPDTIYTIE